MKRRPASRAHRKRNRTRSLVRKSARAQPIAATRGLFELDEPFHSL